MIDFKNYKKALIEDEQETLDNIDNYICDLNRSEIAELINFYIDNHKYYAHLP